jgi:hypothetical protein
MSGPPEFELDRTKRLIREIEDISRCDRTPDDQSELILLYQVRARLSGGIKLFYTPYVFNDTAPI